MNWYKFAGLLYATVIIAFIVAKLTGHFQMSWWWALTPLWLPVVIFIVIAVIAVALFGSASARGENPFQ